MTHTDNVTRNVAGMYMRYPYPNYSAAERKNIMAAELSRYRYLGLEPHLAGSRVLDAGCGTGHRVMPLAQHFDVGEYVEGEPCVHEDRGSPLACVLIGYQCDGWLAMQSIARNRRSPRMGAYSGHGRLTARPSPDLRSV